MRNSSWRWEAALRRAVMGALVCVSSLSGSVGGACAEAEREAWARAGLLAVGMSGVPDNIVRTLASLEKVSDAPVYTLRYAGPYIESSELHAQCGPRTAERAAPRMWGCSLLAAVGDPEAPMFGRNFDWEVSPLLVAFLEPESGYRSVISVDLAYLVDEATVERLDTATPAEILPLLSAPFLPFDGMNDQGLAIAMASVDYECGYPSNPAKRDVGDLELMREILETCATVAQAVAFLDGVNPVSQGGPNMHYVIADPTPAAALIEYDRGRMHVLQSSRGTPWQCGTNFPVALTGGKPEGRCWRYDRIERTLRDKQGDLSSLEAMELLGAVSTPLTRWSIVYDLAKLVSYVRVTCEDADVLGVSLLEETVTLQSGKSESSCAGDTPTTP